MRCVRPDLTTSSNSAAFAWSDSASCRSAGSTSFTSSSSAARCTADGKTSFEDWPMFTSSFGCTSSPESAAMTSFAFMFEEVPEPVWKTSIGNWSSSSPAASRSPAAAMRSALSGSRRPSSAFTRAAAALIRPSQRATGAGIGSPDTGKLATALRVSAPHSSSSRVMLRTARESSLGQGSVRRVLRLDLLAADLRDRVVRRDRSLAHADRDQRDLAGIARDVPGGEDPRQVRLARRRVDLDLPLPLELEPPLGDGAEVRVEAEQRDQRVALDVQVLVSRDVLDRHRGDLPVAVDLAHLARDE